MFGYIVPAPDQAMLISGGRAAGNAPFRVVTGHGAYIMPFFRKVRFLTLAMCEAEVAEKCVTQQGITLNVRAVIAFKVGNDNESVVRPRNGSYRTKTRWRCSRGGSSPATCARSSGR